MDTGDMSTRKLASNGHAGKPPLTLNKSGDESATKKRKNNIVSPIAPISDDDEGEDVPMTPVRPIVNKTRVTDIYESEIDDEDYMPDYKEMSDRLNKVTPIISIPFGYDHVKTMGTRFRLHMEVVFMKPDGSDVACARGDVTGEVYNDSLDLSAFGV